MTTKDRIELAKRINITPKTLYNWENSKPELIKLIMLGLEKEFDNENSKEEDIEQFAKKSDLERIENKITLITKAIEEKALL